MGSADENDKNNFEENLIDLVREVPLLYDKANAEYKDKNKQENAWTRIGETLNKAGKTIKFILCPGSALNFY